MWKQPVSTPKSFTLVFVCVSVYTFDGGKGTERSFAFESHSNYLTYNWKSFLSYPVYSCSIGFILEMISVVMCLFIGDIQHGAKLNPHLWH